MRIILVFIIFTYILYSNNYNSDSFNHNDNLFTLDRSYFSLGLGSDHGGIGARAGYYLTRNLGFFTGVGYSLYEIGYAFGTEIRLTPPEAQILTPILSAWWGTNAFMRARSSENNAIIHQESYTGFSIAFNVRYKTKLSSDNAWFFGVIVPFRTSLVQDDINRFESEGEKVLINQFPLTITIAYSFTLSRF